MSETEKLGADAGAQTTQTTGAADKAASTVSGTIADAGGTTTADTTAATTAATTADWRDSMAGEDKDFRKRLDRFTDPGAFAKSYRALEQKLSSGELKAVTPFPDKGTAEQQAEWRKTNGVPEKAEAYEIKLPNGMVPGEADKPGLERLAKHAHARNWSADQYNAVLEAYYAETDAATAQRDAADGDFRQSSEDALRTDWGPDYRRNVNAVHNLMSAWPEDVRKELLGGRTAGGRLIGDHPGLLKTLAQMSLDINPAATVLPSDFAGVGKSVDGELAEIRKFRQESPDKYDADKAMQARELKLIEAQSLARTRAA